jgi:hypothetical protein
MIDLSSETEELARRLAAAQHLRVDTAVRQALEACAETIAGHGFLSSKFASDAICAAIGDIPAPLVSILDDNR